MDQFVDKGHQGCQEISIGQRGGKISRGGGLKPPRKDVPAFVRLLAF